MIILACYNMEYGLHSSKLNTCPDIFSQKFSSIKIVAYTRRYIALLKEYQFVFMLAIAITADNMGTQDEFKVSVWSYT